MLLSLELFLGPDVPVQAAQQHQTPAAAWNHSWNLVSAQPGCGTPTPVGA